MVELDGSRLLLYSFFLMVNNAINKLSVEPRSPSESVSWYLKKSGNLELYNRTRDPVDDGQTWFRDSGVPKARTIEYRFQIPYDLCS